MHLGLLALLLVVATSRPLAAQTSISLNGPWLFTIDYQRNGEANRWFAADRPTGRWDSVTVPHCWPVDPRYQYIGPAWYRRQFRAPQEWSANHVRLRFEAVFYKSRVWLNGTLVGKHEGGYTPFELDVTRLLQFGEKENTLVVEADNSWDLTTLPGARRGTTPELQSYPWWDYGGIVRDVSLVATPPVFVKKQKIEAVPNLRSGTASVRAVVWVANTLAQESEIAVEIEAFREGTTKALAGSKRSQSVRVPPLSEAPVTFTLELAKAEVALWHPDTPQLYRLKASTVNSSREDRFGIRLIEIRGTQLLLNGEPIRMAGANRTADDPVYGLIEPAAVIERDMRLMKESGMELARIIHYAPAPALLEWADRNGMLLILESGNWQLQPEQMDSPLIRRNWQAQMREMIERDWNHPSVIGWSVGNEYLSRTPAGIKWTRDGRDFVRTLDTSRFVTFASNHAGSAEIKRPEDEASFYVDVVMINTYATGAGAAALLDRIHARLPDKPLLVSEFGIRADLESVEHQKKYFQEFMEVLRARPWVSGASVWTFNDYRSRFPNTNPNGYRWWGAVDQQRNKRPVYSQLREEFSPALLSDAKLDDAGAVAIELKTRNDFPAYTLRKFRTRWTWLDAKAAKIRVDEDALPDLAPGSTNALKRTGPPGAAHLRVEVLRPTGFSMVDREYGLSAARSTAPSGYKLVWSDDFNGNALDTAKWMYRTDVKADSAQRPENISVTGGNLIISLKKEAHSGKNFTGGGVISKERFRYGYYEARVKMHGAAGWHQSVWAMFAGDGSTTYPEKMRTEIDGMEFDSDVPWKGHMGLIKWSGPGQSRSVTCTPGVYRAPLGFDASADFHTYGFEWTEKGVRYFLDGELRCALDYPPTDHEHDQINFWLTAIAYEKLSGKIDETKLPGLMLVDYAAFYEKR